jgi:hypothetical protein
MADFPRIVYKGGILNPNPAYYKSVANAEEMIAVTSEGFWAHTIEKPEDTVNLPFVAPYIATKKAEKKLEEIHDKAVQNALSDSEVTNYEPDVIEPDDAVSEIAQQYKSTTGLDAIQTKGRWKGNETKAFIEWKKMHNKE